MYGVEFSKIAEKQIYKLDKTTQTRIISTIERARIRPHTHIKKLVGSPYFALRSGEYRIIIDLKEEILLIFVIKLGHRKNIYKNL